MEVNSFWIGSVLVIVLTGLYTALGGMRAVAYNDAVQTLVLITGSGLLTIYGLYKLGGWSELRHFCGSEMFNLWRPLVPAGVEGTWVPVLETDATGRGIAPSNSSRGPPGSADLGGCPRRWRSCSGWCWPAMASSC